MSYEIPGDVFSLDAGAPTTIYTFVNVNSDGQAVAPAAGGRVVGVCQDTALAGQAVGVDPNGVSRVVAGEAVPAGSSVETDATGKAMVLDAGKAVGIALTPASAAGEVISVRLTPVA